MIWYNGAIARFEHRFASSTIYAIVYLLFIPASHALMCLLVFGWPTKYLKSLMSNAPIGLSSIVIGATCTAYLDRMGFEVMAEDWVRYHITGETHEETDEAEETGEFYSSLTVMFITGIWTYILSAIVNAPPTTPDKKEL
mmetsp:Transcript_16532/g.37949  ORF Transcript_16532/g.37949 Transcript_16532/m.37949 type:complete len:140 (+) Transcript_16532:387-806(+)